LNNILIIVFENAEDDITFQKAIILFHQTSILAASHHLIDLMDNIVIALTRSTGLLKNSSQGSLSDGESTDERGRHKPILDRWIVDFGRNYRGQIASILLFHIIGNFGDFIHAGWKNVSLKYISLLFCPPFFFSFSLQFFFPDIK